VTIDANQFKTGALAVWHHLPRGGYGYIHVVPCVVVRCTGKRVRIAVRKTDGFVVERSVKAESLSSVEGDANRAMAERVRESLKLRLTKGGASCSRT
jgi:hypothetical protein